MSVTEQNYATSTNDEIGLAELFDIIWRGKWLVLAFSVIFAAGSVYYALQLPNIYRAETILSPLGKDGGIQLPGQLSGLASLAGVNLGGLSKGDNTNLALEVMVSREFLSRFIEKHQLLVPLIAAEGWDPDTDSLILDPEKYNLDTQQWVRKPSAYQQVVPTAWEAVKVFKERFTLTRDKASGMVKLTLEHVSPTLAAEWLNKLVHDINEEMRQREMAEAQRSIDYLTEQVRNTVLTDLRTTLFSLIEEQTQTLMLANVRDEYMFRTVDPAVMPEERFKPRRSIIAILGTFGGAFLALLILFVREFSFKGKTR
ncbi:MAG: Wzz/FepE/Etk N-terminal domain-containing protein [Alishewanella aestuarii]